MVEDAGAWSWTGNFCIRLVCVCVPSMRNYYYFRTVIWYPVWFGVRGGCSHFDPQMEAGGGGKEGVGVGGGGGGGRVLPWFHLPCRKSGSHRPFYTTAVQQPISLPPPLPFSASFTSCFLFFSPISYSPLRLLFFAILFSCVFAHQFLPHSPPFLLYSFPFSSPSLTVVPHPFPFISLLSSSPHLAFLYSHTLPSRRLPCLPFQLSRHLVPSFPTLLLNPGSSSSLLPYFFIFPLLLFFHISLLPSPDCLSLSTLFPPPPILYFLAILFPLPSTSNCPSFYLKYCSNMLLAPYVIVYLLLYFFIQVKIKSNNQQNSEYYDLILRVHILCISLFLSVLNLLSFCSLSCSLPSAPSPTPKNIVGWGEKMIKIKIIFSFSYID